jgi:hypothetical protein
VVTVVVPGPPTTVLSQARVVPVDDGGLGGDWPESFWSPVFTPAAGTVVRVVPGRDGTFTPGGTKASSDDEVAAGPLGLVIPPEMGAE